MSLTSFETILLDCILTAVISACIKNLIKIGEFLCGHFNIEDGRKYTTFWHIMFYYFKKGKNSTETQKRLCAVYGEGAVTTGTCQKWFAKFLDTIDILAK